MSERTYTETTCDLCNRKIEAGYSILQNCGWTKISYRQDWKSGCHAGTTDKEFIVCNKCSEGKGIKYLFYIIRILSSKKYRKLLGIS